MVIALWLVVAGQSDAQSARLAKLSAQRGAFERQYVSSKRESLQITENLGTNNLGNPGRLWLYPAGSAEYRVWLCTFGGYEEADPKTGKDRRVPTSAYLVYQSRHGKITTTDWAVKLAEGRRNTRAAGTLFTFVRDHDYHVAQPLSRSERATLNKVQAYVALSPGRGENWGIYTWFVSKDGHRAKGYYACFPEADNFSTYDVDRILQAPPIVPEEAKAMGIHLERLWHGPGRFTAQFETDFAKYDFSD